MVHADRGGEKILAKLFSEEYLSGKKIGKLNHFIGSLHW